MSKNIIKEFNGKNSIGHIAYKYNVKKSIIEDLWLKAFGIKKVKEREKVLLSALIKCPVCEKSGSREHILRHLMNSRKENNHNSFIKNQDLKIEQIYKSVADNDLDPHKVASNLFCSTAHVRKIFSRFPDYRTKLKNKRSVDVRKQYNDGRRLKPKNFNNGWKLTKENGGKRFITKKKLERIVILYSSNLTQKAVAKEVQCKEETVNKYWVEKFGKSAVSARNKKTFLASISKINDKNDKLLKKYFYEDRTKKSLSKEFNVSITTILNFFRKHFTTRERQERAERLQRYGLHKSLRINGLNGHTGSIPENKCYEYLKNKLDAEVIHHNLDILPPYEIDISIPELKIAICWDGPFHRYPIFGDKKLKRVINRDVKKIKGLLSLGWRIVVVEDDQKKFKSEIVLCTVKTIIDWLNSSSNSLLFRVENKRE